MMTDSKLLLDLIAMNRYTAETKLMADMKALQEA